MFPSLRVYMLGVQREQLREYRLAQRFRTAPYLDTASVNARSSTSGSANSVRSATLPALFVSRLRAAAAVPLSGANANGESKPARGSWLSRASKIGCSYQPDTEAETADADPASEQVSALEAADSATCKANLVQELVVTPPDDTQSVAIRTGGSGRDRDASEASASVSTDAADGGVQIIPLVAGTT